MIEWLADLAPRLLLLPAIAAMAMAGFAVALGLGWVLCRICTLFGWRKDGRRKDEFTYGAAFTIFLLVVNLWAQDWGEVT